MTSAPDPNAQTVQPTPINVATTPTADSILAQLAEVVTRLASLQGPLPSDLAERIKALMEERSALESHITAIEAGLPKILKPYGDRIEAIGIELAVLQGGKRSRKPKMPRTTATSSSGTRSRLMKNIMS